jgi:DNA topoisomerase-1
MYSHIFKDSAASSKAWESRTRAVVRVPGSGKGLDKVKGYWVSADGKPLNKHTQHYVDTVAIPPAWKDVMVSTEPNAKLIATGVDTKGHTQPKYSAEHTEKSKLVKFARVKKLTDLMPKLINQSKKDMMNAKLSVRERDNAATVHLISKTGFRPGGDSADAYGASTLEKRHVKVEGDTISFNFVGKHKVNQVKKLKDPSLAEYLGPRLKSLKDGDKVFATSGASAARYMRKIVGNDYLIKDLRTWTGTSTAKTLIAREPVPTNEAELKDQQKRISDVVSKRLGNTPAVALDSYIDPSVWFHTGGMTSVSKGKK